MKKIIFLILLATTIAAKAQQPNFSGNWKRNNDMTQVNGISLNSVPITIIVKQDKATLTLTRTSVNDKGEKNTYTEDLPLDGKTVETLTPSKLKRAAKIEWLIEQKAYVETFISKNDQGEVVQSGKLTLSLSDEGNTLQIRVTQTYGKRSFEMNQVYDKQ